MKTNKKIWHSLILSWALLSLFSTALFSQDNTTPEPTKEYVKKTFENGVMINNQTVETPYAKTLDFMIQHRFGIIKNRYDLFGIFAPANIRLGLTYGITKDLSVGGGAAKDKSLYDLEWKYIVLKQEKTGGMPVTLAYYGNMSSSDTRKSQLYNQDNELKPANRLTYFHELMIARKFNDKISVQLAPSYTHINFVRDSLMNHDIFGLSFIGRYRFNVMSSVQLEFDYPLNPDDIKDATGATTYNQKPNLSLGYEMSTGSHQFQVFITTANGIVGPQVIGYNQNDFTKKELLIGFNLTRQFDF